jgi:hypothetical protein
VAVWWPCKGHDREAQDHAQDGKTDGGRLMGTTNQPNYKKKPKPAKNNAPKLPKK